jgi:hypothetical protein
MAHMLEADKTKLQIADWRINVTKLTSPELIYYCDYGSIPMSMAAKIIWNLLPKRSTTFLRIPIILILSVWQSSFFIIVVA